MELMVTEKAKDKLKELGLSGHKYLRVGVKTGGCSGHLYAAMIEEKMNDNDHIYYEDDGVCIISDEFSAVYLDGLTVDFSDDLIESGFRLTNAKAGGSCGCGASFNTEAGFSV